MEKGEKLGFKNGVSKRNEEIAKNMLSGGMNIRDIQKYTGISQKKLSEIQMI